MLKNTTEIIWQAALAVIKSILH